MIQKLVNTTVKITGSRLILAESAASKEIAIGTIFFLQLLSAFRAISIRGLADLFKCLTQLSCRLITFFRIIRAGLGNHKTHAFKGAARLRQPGCSKDPFLHPFICINNI